MKVLILLLSLSLWTNSAIAVNDFSAIDKYVNAAKKEVGLPSGTAIAIVKDGKIIYEGYFGYANIKENIKVTNETAFYLASLTKPMFALSILLVEQHGDIKDTTLMSQMFPKLDIPFIDKNKIQLKHLMSHTSGIENRPLGYAFAYTGNHNKAQRHKLLTVTKIKGKGRLGEFDYTNLGYNIASIWVEDYYQQDWQEKISELIYQPLGMVRTSSYMSDAAKQGIDVARPYGLYRKDPEEILPFEKHNSTMHSAGGTISTATDMARFLVAQLNRGRVDGKQVFPSVVIKKSHKKLATTDLKYGDFVRKGYAWGWYVGPYKNEEMYHHFGGVAGTDTHLSYMLKHNIGLVILNNESRVSSKLTNAIADITYSILLHKGNADDKADAHIKKMKKYWTKLKTDIQKSKDYKEKIKRERTMALSLERSKYVGVFHNDLWGNMEVELSCSNEFEFTLGELSAVATAYTKPNTMRVEFPAIGGGKIVTYKTEDGKVTELEVFGEKFNKL